MRWQLASTFAAIAMSGCYEEATIPCPNGVLCPADQACTGNAPSDDLNVKLCALEADVVDCAGKQERDNCDGANGAGLCISNVCEPCKPEFYECRYDAWTEVESPAGLTLDAVFMLAPDRAFAVGGSGAMLTYDGKGWTKGIAGLVSETNSYTGVWATTSTVYVTSEDAITATNAASVSSVPPSVVLNGIWGRTPNDIVAVGTDEVIGSFDGSWSWTPAGFGALYATWGWDDQLVAVGAGGALYTRVGTTWAKSTPVPDDLAAVWGSSKTDFYVIGNQNGGLNGRIWHYTGTWTDETPSAVSVLNGVWGSEDGHVYVVGHDGTILEKTPTTPWTPMVTPSPAVRLVAISGVGLSAFAVGSNGEVWRISR
jgi:hypothetical protein